MSEQAPERAPARARGGNVFTHRIGPLPMWIWVAVIGGVIVAWSLYKSRTSGQSSTASSSGDTGTPAADVPQFVNQTYTTVTPPTVNVTEPGGDDDDEVQPPARVKFPIYHPPVKPPVKKPPAKKSPVPPIFNAVYVVRKGETLNSIAAKFKVTRVALAHANGLGTGAGLRTGQKLKVPNPAGYGKPNKAA